MDITNTLFIAVSPEDLDRIKIALDWYEDDRRECAKVEARSLYDAGSEESLAAADEANATLARLRAQQAPLYAETVVDALEDAVDQLQACSAWQDALRGDDDAMLRAVNKAGAVIARIRREEFEPVTATEETD